MTISELKKLIAGGESETVEFKRSTGQHIEATKTICAMLNGIGGHVFFGISDKGEIVGQQVSSRTTDELSNELRRIEPPVFPEIRTIRVENDLSVISIEVSSGDGPYTFDGRPYLRHASTTRVMPRSEYEKLLMERLHATHRWENQPVAAGVSIDDLDEEEIFITVDNAVQQGRLEAPKKRDVKAILRGLGLKTPRPRWSEQAGSVVATFKPSAEFKVSAMQVTPQVTPQVTGEVGLLLPLCMVPKTRKELLELLDLKDREHFRKGYLIPALEGSYIERTIPDKPQSSKQRYRLTEKGKKWLEENRKKSFQEVL